MKLHYSLAVANKILRRLMRDPELKNIDAVIECYSNGREQGFAVTYEDRSKIPYERRAIIFAEDRHTDKIVIYNTDYNFGIIGEEAYANKKLLKPELYTEAKDYIVSLLLDAVLNNKLQQIK